MKRIQHYQLHLLLYYRKERCSNQLFIVAVYKYYYIFWDNLFYLYLISNYLHIVCFIRKSIIFLYNVLSIYYYVYIYIYIYNTSLITLWITQFTPSFYIHLVCWLFVIVSVSLAVVSCMIVLKFSSAAWNRAAAVARPVWSTSARKNPPGFCKSSKGCPNSTAWPASITNTRSLSITVCKRWAIVRTVQSENFVRIVFWISLSVLQRNV